ncbi:MAG: hypothetical protein DMG58_06350 [Acidobacteria bacterium]|nr:MAG: hypothetical protein DMG58_06350 [Acidobacteriota bacterium]
MRNAFSLLVLTLGLASGQATKTAQERQDILDYPLTLQRANQLIAALPQMTQYVLTLPPDVLAKSAKKTRAERIDSLEKDPKGMAILKKNGLTAKDYIIGVPALRMALWRAQGMAESSLVYASPANLAFAKANLAQLKPKWDAAEGRPAK